MWATIALISHELLLFAACGFLLFGVDDLVVDLHWLRHLMRRQGLPTPNSVRLRKEQPHTLVAVFVPAWREAEVIGAMIDRCNRAWGTGSFCIFVGTYRNDPATQAEITQRLGDKVIMVVLDRDGPTTKADCLNGLWHAMAALEAENRKHFGAVLLHDAEDHVHADEILLFGELTGQFGLVQIPVVPVPDPHSHWIAGHYADEFAESHIKELVVRQLVGASLPSAGTGCAVSRAALERIAETRGGKPFDADSLTEDYELGLHIGQLGLKSHFVRQTALGGRGLITVRSCFPNTFDAAVRQKTRWIIGIALAGWDRTGWRGGFAEHWMRWRDRRVILAALLIVSAYGGGMMASLLWVVGRTKPPDPLMSTLLTASLSLFLWRTMMRSVCSAHQYGWRQGLLSVPRVAISNGVSVAASFMAVVGYIRILWTGEVRWAKTEHQFPSQLDVS